MRSFTARVTWQFAALVTATTALVLAVGGWLQSRAAVRGLDFLNAAEFEELHARLGEEPRGVTRQEVDQRVRAHATIDASQYYFQVSTRSGVVLFRSDNLDDLQLPLPQTEQRQSAVLPEIGRVRVAEFVTGDLRVQIASSLEPVERLLGAYAQTSLMLLGGVALASVGLGWYFARLTLRPVRAIRETASRIGAETLSERIPLPPGRDELTALADLLNQMFDRLEGSFAQVKRFTADASHELKTPLALLRLNAEKLRGRLAADAEASAAVDEMLEDLDALRRVIDTLLFLAKAESGSLAPAMSEISAAEWVRSFGEDAAVMSEERGVVFAVTRADAGAVQCEPTLVRQVLLNLLTNALRVVPAGGRIELESTVTETSWRLTMSDEGPGLPREQVERVFERFVRFAHGAVDDAQPNGHGLGLAICRSIAGLHGGRIHAENRTERRGLRVVLELPISGVRS
ncbi:ATP-binding protein [Opitutus terrae]|uniref:histidine kinase n=1 Tax=Opitutus terrae (strain DSM 11246 / JCM 15787 / PB90-1) TaxID=452637 RepID=B1ZS17_OPITP|nr:ATP-binding protein [Opitutus terrae]ACB74693.1 integral membrane sensor signal transduction histidine kinase [Opitutus terrae PB90-1]